MWKHIFSRFALIKPSAGRLRPNRRKFCTSDKKVTDQFSFGIQHKYCAEDTDKIIQTVNQNSLDELLSYDVSKGRAQKIRSWVNRNGPFTHVDQILDVDGFGVKNLAKFCNSIINDDWKNSPRIRPAHRNQQFVTPALTPQIRSELQSFTSVHIGITSISWAQFKMSPENPTRLADWSFNQLPDKKMHISEFISSVLEIVTCIPDSSMYVFETPRVAHQGPQGTPATVNISVQMSQMAAMTAMSLAARPPQKEFSSAAAALANCRVVFLREFLAARLFHTIVGTERTSTASVINDLMMNSLKNLSSNDEKLKDDRPIAGEIVISPALQKSYYSAIDGHCKEYLGQSLLMGLSFLRLCVLQCPYSLDVLRRRARN